MGDNFRTDQWILNMVGDHFDPCPYNEAHDPEIYDGLAIEWEHDRVFVNPPYSNPKPWVIKAIETHYKYNNVVMMLLKHDSSTEWFRLLHEAGARLMMINRRLKYQTSKAANFPSVFVVLG